MPRKLRAHFRQQFVGYVALFVALGGSAYATATIGANNIKNDAVRSRHIKDGAVKAADIDPALLASLTPHCPTGLRRAGDLCFEPTARPGGTSWEEAIRTCARAQLRLPNAGELALVFDHLGAPQGRHWVANAYFDANGSDNRGYGGAVMEEPDRTLLAERAYLEGGNVVYRCVTSATSSP
jgi:hypothetical protein